MKKIAILLLAALSGLLHAQGPLSPPAAPAATMKTLTQVEPRTPISSLPYTIIIPGSYYLTDNLQFTATSGNAITVIASNVTIDLMGFTLSSTALVTGNAISISSSTTRGIRIRNGNIVGNTTVTTSGSPTAWAVSAAGFNIGINDKSSGGIYSDLTIRGCRTYGLYADNSALVDTVYSEQNGTSGIYTNRGTLTRCSASYNGGTGISAFYGSTTNCTADVNGSSGIYAYSGIVKDCKANSNGSLGISANYGNVTNCSAVANGTYGIYAPAGCAMACTARDNPTADISATSRTGNYPAP